MIRFVCPRCWAVREIADDSMLGSIVKCNECHAMAVAGHTPDPAKTGRGRKTTRLAAPPPAAQPVSGAAPAPPAAPGSVVLSTGDIPGDYDILDLVFAQASSLEGPDEKMAAADVFKLAKRRLANEAAQLGAGAVLHIHFDFRPNSKTRALEVFACGTAVRLRPST